MKFMNKKNVLNTTNKNLLTFEDYKPLLKTNPRRNHNRTQGKSRSKERSKSYQANFEERKRTGSAEQQGTPQKHAGKIRRERLKSAFVQGNQLAQTQVTESQNLIADSDGIAADVKKLRSPQSTITKPESTQISRAEFLLKNETPYGPQMSVNRSIYSFENQNRFDIRTKSMTTAQNIANLFLQQESNNRDSHYLASEMRNCSNPLFIPLKTSPHKRVRGPSMIRIKSAQIKGKKSLFSAIE